VSIDPAPALARVNTTGDEWQRWRARRLTGEDAGDVPPIPYQDAEGGFIGPGGGPSPGATGEALCQLVVCGLAASGQAAIAADWLEAARTPAMAWLDAPDDVPGELDSYAGGRVWATASAACGLLAIGRDPGHRAVDLLRGEADVEGRFTGGAYPTFAAAGAYWLAEGPKTEIAEWALRWARESEQESWGPWEFVTALTFWGAARIPAEHPSVEGFAETLDAVAPREGWPSDDGLTLRTLELVAFFGF
jgi:hypothetical protein